MNKDFQFSQQPPSVRAAVLIGLFLVVFGTTKFISLFIPVDVWDELVTFFGSLMRFLWPLALVTAGVFIIWSARNGKFAGFAAAHTHGEFMRSRTDKRLLGVCGGIAYYFGVDSAMVRILAVILFILLPFPVFIAYFLIALLVPRG